MQSPRVVELKGVTAITKASDSNTNIARRRDSLRKKKSMKEINEKLATPMPRTVRQSYQNFGVKREGRVRLGKRKGPSLDGYLKMLGSYRRKRKKKERKEERKVRPGDVFYVAQLCLEPC